MRLLVKEANDVDERFKELQTRILGLLERARNLEIRFERQCLEESTDQNVAGGDVAMEVDVEDTKPTDTDAEDKANGDGNV